MTLATALALFGPYLVALAALAGTIYSIRSQRTKMNADASESIATASSSTINDLTEELARLNLKMAAQLLQMQDLRVSAKRTLELIARLLQGITLLLDQLHKAGLVPAWQPDPEIERLVALCTQESDRLAIPRINLNQGSATKP
jgi:hypothetical protein